MTTVALRPELKERLREFGSKGQTYADIIERLLESAEKRQLEELLMDETDTIPIEQAIAEARAKWSA